MHSESKRYDFERLYIDCQPRLTAYALRFVNNPIEAQDLVHNCFMALWDRQAPLDTEEARMLLFAMTRNRCLNYLKHKSIVDKYTVSYLARAKVGEERLYNYDFSFAENGHPYLYQELEQQIQRIMDSLPERCREVFLLSRFQGLKNREIAERLHIGRAAHPARPAHLRRGTRTRTIRLPANTDPRLADEPAVLKPSRREFQKICGFFPEPGGGKIRPGCCIYVCVQQPPP